MTFHFYKLQLFYRYTRCFYSPFSPSPSESSKAARDGIIILLLYLRCHGGARYNATKNIFHICMFYRCCSFSVSLFFFVCNLCFSDIEKGFKSSILSFQTIKQSFSALQEATTEQIMYQTIKNGSIFSNRHRKHHSIDITKCSYQRPNYISVFSIFTLRNHIFKYHYE